MKFDPSFIEKVRDANNISEIIGQHTQLKSSSPGQQLGLCPYPDHNEKTASFSVSDSKQVYYCFGCKKSGNVFTFLKDIMGMGFPEAVEYLARRASIDMPKVSVSKEEAARYDKAKEEKKVLKRINEFACATYQKNLQQLDPNSEFAKYIASRNFSKEVIETFRMGFAADEWEHLAGRLMNTKASLAGAEKLGLIKRSKNTTKSQTGYFDIMRGRLMFPIISPSGDVIGFGGRVLKKEDNPKYLNSPESPIFHKGKTFYGLYETAKYIRTKDFAIVVEGYTDLIALYSAGIKNVVATLGTALTEDHAKLLKRFTKNVVVLFDGDQAGQIAAERSLPILLRAGMYPRGYLLPEGMDPDEFLKREGVDRLTEELNRAPELFQIIMDSHFQGYRGGATEKVTIVDKLTPYLAQASDKRLRSLYIGELKDRLGVSEEWMRSALKGGASAKPKPIAKPAEAPQRPQNTQQIGNNYSDLEKVKIVNPPKAELYLLNLSLKSSENLERVADSGVLEQFSHRKMGELILEIHQKYLQNLSEFDKLTASLVDRIEPVGLLNLQFEKHLAELKSEDEIKLVEDCISRVKQEALKRKSRELALAMSGQSPAEQERQLEKLRDLQKSKLDVNKLKDLD